MAFKDSVEDYIGGTYSDTTALSRWLTDSARFLINLIPPEKLDNFTSSVIVTTDGLSVKEYRISRVHKAGYESTYVDIGLKAQAINSSSIHYAIDSSPKHYYENSKLYVVPNGGTAQAVAYPTVVYSGTTISNFPTDLMEALYIKTAIRCLLTLSGVSAEELSNLEYYLAVPPTAPEDLTTIGAFGTLPIYNTPTVPVISYALTESRLTNDDTELANAEMNKLKTQLEQWASNQRDANAKFQEELVEYEGSVKRALEVASLASKETFELYGMGLQKYGQEINNYTQKFQNELTKIVKRIEVNGIRINELKQELADIIGSYVNS